MSVGFAVCLALCIVGSSLAPASAQTVRVPPPRATPTASAPRPEGPTPGNAGAFARLAPGQQKIALALFEAQERPTPPAPQLTLEDIARMKAGGQAWAEIIDAMTARGLGDEAHLKQVIREEAR